MRHAILETAKFLAALVLIPVIVAATISFRKELLYLAFVSRAFTWGVSAYLLFHFFVAPLEKLYLGGQKVWEVLLRYAPVMSRAIPLALPIFASAVLTALIIDRTVLGHSGREIYYGFFAGFFLAMHVILTAQAVRSLDTGIVKSGYCLCMGLAYLGNLCVVLSLMSFALDGISVLNFLKSSATLAASFYDVLFRHVILKLV
ncbi:MAG: hypothetical protein Q8Q08_10190 [Candidatus Omnitrophota bacterium]|nr:hypothetical protein [Candidatus Omnitrophota bacterium]MDZ4241584.1 hypothetical protein [Candidatus Omnitrophota bacterium]